MILVYVAGPYSLGDTITNIRVAYDAAEVLWNAGYLPFVPHGSYSWHLLYPKPEDVWYAMDLAYLDRCDMLLRIPGISLGADREVEYAREHGIPVFEGTAREFVEGMGEIPKEVE